MKISFWNEGKCNTLIDEGKLRICQWNYSNIMAKYFYETKANDKRSSLEHQERRKNKVTSKNVAKYNPFSFSYWVFPIMFDG